MDYNTQNEIVKEYKAGASLKSLARKYPQCVRTIKKVLVDNGIKIEFRENGKRKFVLNHKHFEIIDSAKKAYLLGYLFADGYVLADLYTSGITLARTDRSVLEMLSKEVYGSDEPVYDIPKMQTNKIPQSRIIFKSKEFQRHLVDKNMVHNKSLILAPPLGVPQNLIKDFILGYFDGDGCFTCGKWEIVSTRPFCQWVADYLTQACGVSNYVIKETKNNVTCRLSIVRVMDVVRLYEFFYLNSPSQICLERKRIKMSDFVFSRNLEHHSIIN